MADQDRKERRDGFRRGPGPSEAGSAASYAGVGAQFVVSILFFLYLGKWLDGKLGTDPLLLIVGVFVGAAVGIYNMYRMMTAAQRKAQKEKTK